MLELTNRNAFGIVQESKLAAVVSLSDHLAHAVNMVKECGAILSLVLACSEHPKACISAVTIVSSGSTSLTCVPHGQGCGSPAVRVAGKCKGVAGTQV